MYEVVLIRCLIVIITGSLLLTSSYGVIRYLLDR
jgi:hypothetical protein